MIKRFLSFIICLTLIFSMFPTVETMTLAAAGDYDATEGYGENTVYAVSTSHLDTCWSWTTKQAIEEFLPATFADNYLLIDKYPEYEFNYEGAYRYALLKEYYPELYAKLQNYVDAGNWNVSGSSWVAGDVNIVSPEGLFRNILYGNGWFDENLGVRSKDIYLPDCFGFGYALPAVMSASNLLGFSTQKLSWGSSVGNRPGNMDFGRWTGVGGKTALAYFNLNGYTENFANGVTGVQGFLDKINNNPLRVSEALYGSRGDRGGAAPEPSIRSISEEYKNNANAGTKVKFASTDELFKDVTNAGLTNNLGNYNGELLMTAHGSGCYTSRANSKRYNRKNELLGVAAETVNVQSDWLGNTNYDADRFETIWNRVIMHQFHDDITGTSNSEIYAKSWNDYIVSLKQFEKEYESGVKGIAAAMNTESTQTNSVPVVVNNTLGFDRKEVVEATVTISGVGDKQKYVRVYDGAGNEVPSQVVSGKVENGTGTYQILFQAEVSSLGSRVYHVVPDTQNSPIITDLSNVSQNNGNYILKNEKYKVTINDNGDISSIYDLAMNRELLESPIRLSLQTMTDKYWASWELNTGDYWNKLGTDYVSGDNVSFKIIEDGTCRTSLQIIRNHGNSTYTQTVRLAAGGQFVTIDNLVDWQEKALLLKAEFNTNSSNEKATYDLGLGAIERGNNTSSLAEVPVQQWADISNSDGSFGVTVLNDGKTGMDKYDNNTFRLSLIYTPSNDYSHDTDSSSGNPNEFYSAGEYCQDQGENRFSYGVYGHSGKAGDSDAAKMGQAFSTHMTVTQTVAHEGVLGDNFSSGSISGKNVVLRALKKSDMNDDLVIIRVNEMSGKAEKGVTLTLGDGIEAASEVYASEEYKADANVKDGKLVFDMDGYEVKTFALKLKASDTQAKADTRQKVLPLEYNLDAYSPNSKKMDGSINALGDCYPAELVPGTVKFAGVTYNMGPSANGYKNAVQCKGQTLTLNGGYNKLYILAASSNGDKDAVFKVDNKSVTLNIGDYAESIGAGNLYDLGMTEYIKEQTPAFEATHRHTNGKDNVTASTYMFTYELDITDASTVTLPQDSDIILFAATQKKDKNADTTVVTRLIDSIPREETIKNRLDTGFENGDTTILQNKVNEKTDLDGISNNSCAVTTEKASAGSHSLKITGSDTSSDKTCVYYTLSEEQIRIQNGTILQFDLYADNDLGRFCSIDLDFNYNVGKCGQGQIMNGSAMRDDSRMVDITGVRTHPNVGHGTVGKWVTVTVDLSKILGGDNITVTKIMLAYDHPADTGNFTAYVDNLFVGVPDNAMEIALNKAEELDRTAYTKASIADLDKAVATIKAVKADNSGTLIEKRAVDSFYEAYENLVLYRSAYTSINAWDYQHKSFNSICVDTDNGNPTNIGGVSSGGWAKYAGLDFGNTGANAFQINYSGWKTGTDCVVEIRSGSKNGTLLGKANIPQTSDESSVDWSKYTTVTCNLDKAVTGSKDIYLVFKNGSGGNVCNVKNFTFLPTDSRNALSRLYFEASQLDLSAYATAPAAQMESALSQAKAVIENESADQNMIDSALDILQTAMNDLEKGVLLKGDLNKDGSFTVTDVVLLRKAVLSNNYNVIGDMNGDKILANADIEILRSTIMN